MPQQARTKNVLMSLVLWERSTAELTCLHAFRPFDNQMLMNAVFVTFLEKKTQAGGYGPLRWEIEKNRSEGIDRSSFYR